MTSITWTKALELIKPYVFKVSTPRGSGTGFQLFYRESTGFCGVATALHVIEHAYDWEDPIKLFHYASKETKMLKMANRVIFTYPSVDLAIILFHPEKCPIEKNSLQVIDKDKRKKQGVEIGWCGFPAIAPDDLCFFTGRISSWLEGKSSYLVDGVAINGVSGGPAFTIVGDITEICGVVSAYIPNRATSESLPGVCVIRDVAPYQQALQALKSFEEARKKAEQNGTEQKVNSIESPVTKEITKSKSPVTERTAKKKATAKKVSVKKPKASGRTPVPKTTIEKKMPPKKSRRRTSKS